MIFKKYYEYLCSNKLGNLEKKRTNSQKTQTTNIDSRENKIYE